MLSFTYLDGWDEYRYTRGYFAAHRRLFAMRMYDNNPKCGTIEVCISGQCRFSFSQHFTRIFREEFHRDAYKEYVCLCKLLGIHAFQLPTKTLKFSAHGAYNAIQASRVAKKYVYNSHE